MKKFLVLSFAIFLLLSVTIFAAPSAVEVFESADEINFTDENNISESMSNVDEQTAELMGTYGDLTYSVSNGKVTIVGCSTSVTSVTVPSTIDGYPVTEIIDGTFRNCSNLKEITLPFVGSKKIKSGASYSVFGAIFGYSIFYHTGTTYQKIGENAGYYYYIPSSLKKVTITDETVIPFGAFSNCSSLTSIEIPNSITSIADYGFSNCYNLTSVEIPNSITSIADYAFSNCYSLTSVEIPNSVTNIGDCAFSGCSNLSIYCCDKSYAYTYANENNIPVVIKHRHSDWTETVAPTCSSTGEKIISCTACGVVLETEVVPELGHNHVYYETVDPTCNEKGYELHICSRCDDEKQIEIPVKEHPYGDWTVTTEPTCTEDGEKKILCTVCGYEKESAVVSMLGHNHVYNSKVDSTCTETGYELHICSRCDDEKRIEIPVKEHPYGDWTVTTEPTCTEDGEKKILCTVCGHVKETEVIPELGHEWSEWVETKAPTYVETGIETRTCDVCGETEDRDIDVIPFIDVESVSLNKSSVNLNVGDTVNLDVTIVPEDASDKTITWTSSNNSVATVDEDGVVKAIAKGSAIITATSHNGISVTCEINVGVVADKVEFTSLKTTSLAVGKYITLKATASRFDGKKPQSTAVTYEIIEGEDFATIDAKGKLTAKAVGEVVVRATAEFGTEEAYADITINICIPATKVTLNTTKASMIVDGTLKLTATMTPANNTDTITWSVDKEDVATVDENGVVTAHKAGKVKVTSTAGGGKSASCTITIGEPATKVEFTGLKSTSLALGKSIILKAKASCEGKTKPVSTDVVYEIVGGEEFATIDAKGKLKGIAIGEVTVRARAEAGTEDAYADVTINICIPATKVTLNMTKASMIVGGEDLSLEATMTPANNTDTLTWSVDKDDIATVDENGVVTAHKAGKVKVTAASGSGKKATCTITVGELATKVEVTALKVTSVAFGKSLTLKGKAGRDDKIKPVSTAVVFEIIEGEDLATIDAKGKLTANKEGNEGYVVVRIRAEAGTEDAYEDVTIRVCTLATKVTLSMTKATLSVGDELQLEAEMTAKGECTDTLTWSVDKPQIATVDENGLVTAHMAGKVKVTATSGSGKKGTCTITVTK